MYEKLSKNNGYILSAEDGKISLDYDGEHKDNEEYIFDLPIEWEDTSESREIALFVANAKSKQRNL